jgi:hypothetical protein
LQASTVAEMHRWQAKTPFEGQNMVLGSVEGLQNDQRVMGHTGAVSGFGSSFDLLPGQGLGCFIGFNEEYCQTSAWEIISAFRAQLLDRFFPN